MLVIFALTIHLPGMMGAETDQEMQLSMSSLLKDASLVGAAWYVAGRYNEDDSKKEES